MEPICKRQPACRKESACRKEPVCKKKPVCRREPIRKIEPACKKEPVCRREPVCKIEPACRKEPVFPNDKRSSFLHWLTTDLLLTKCKLCISHNPSVCLTRADLVQSYCKLMWTNVAYKTDCVASSLQSLNRIGMGHIDCCNPIHGCDDVVQSTQDEQ